MSQDLPERIAKLRTKARLTQVECATGIGVSERQWQRYEYGETPISLEVLGAIAALFGLTRADLL